MALSNIGWTDFTWNIATGCDKVSPGCKFCYMMRDAERWNKDMNGIVIRTKPNTFNKPLKLKEPLKIFACSLTDFFHPAIDSYRDEAWKIIKDCPQHTFQILTKRTERIYDHLPADWGNGYPNVLLGASIESDNFKHRLVQLHSGKKASSVFQTFVSYEPAIGYLDLENDDIITSVEFERLDWLIVGGESGHGKIPNDPNVKWKYRECKLEWIEDIVQQCQSKGVKVFVKQLGTHLAKTMNLKDRTGSDINEFPEHLKLQQFPVRCGNPCTSLQSICQKCYGEFAAWQKENKEI